MHDQSDQDERQNEKFDAFVTRLKAMPASDPRSRAAILARVRGRRQSPWRATLAWAWQPSIPVLAAATIVVAAIGLGYGGRVLVEPTVPVADRASVPLQLASNVSNSISLVPQQLVFKAPGANRVSVVGDFNEWKATPMSESSHSGVWEIQLLLTPGRHTYAFIVNDTLWNTDPRAQTSPDPDFGRNKSVLLVAERQ